MERSEPTLVPEWLKNGGSLAGGGRASHSDDHTASKLARNKSLVTSNGHDFGRPSGKERITSSFRRSSSSNGSGHLRSYSSFARNHRYREWEDMYGSWDKEKPVLGDRRHEYISDPLGGNILSSKFELDGLRSSQSMISGKHGQSWPKKVITDSSNASGSNSNGLLSKGSPISSVNKTTFERDFPSLGAEERPATPEVGRIPSPGLSTAIQNLPIGTSAMIGGEKWTSALAEVPIVTGKLATPSSSAPLALGTTSGLNMAATVAQGPTRVQTMPQLSAGTQRLEELAIKQSRQLIPVTPSMSKPLVLTSLDKQKTKGGQLQHPISPSLSVSHSPRGGLVKSDVSKMSNVGKLHVLKPARERNAVSSAAKDNLSPKSGSKFVNSSLFMTTSTSASGAALIMSPANNSISPSAEHKPVLTALEKRPTTQAQSRNDFFNLMRKKSMSSSSSVPDQSTANSLSVSDRSTALSPPASDKVGELEVSATSTNAGDAPSRGGPSEGPLSDKNGDLTCNGDACEGQKHFSNGKKHQNSDPVISEEEATFLRSLGWEENADEGGLTEEEISDFYRDITKHIDSNPSLKILLQPKFVLSLDSQIGNIGGISSGLSSSETKMES